MPFRNSWAEDFGAAGIDSLPEFPNGGPYLNAVSPEFLGTMGIDIRLGRGIESTDAAGTLPVVVLSEFLASRLWPAENPLGRCVFIGETRECTTVVGIAENAHRQTLIEEPEALYYLPAAQHRAKFPARVLFVRVRAGSADVRMGLRQELERLDGGIRYASVRSYEDVIDPQARAWTLGASMFTLFGVLALAVAGLGIYSVFVFDVSRRVPEIGIRGALGASTGQIVRLVLFDVAKVSGIGLILGLIAAVFAAPLLAPLLYNVSPRDPLVLSIVAITLAIVALGAGALPALRATRVDPNVALRTE
jgi:ABC-type lipoprotein release transport system permease subunit